MPSSPNKLPEPLPWQRGDLSGVVLPGYEDLSPALLPWADAIAKRQLPGEIVLAKRSRSRVVFAFSHRGERLFAKRATSRTWKHRVSSFLQGPKTEREWTAQRAFLELGVLAPVPVLQAGDGAGVSYLVTRALPPTWTSLHVWTRTNPINAAFLESIARYTAWLHGLPAYHHDYRADHLFLTDAPADAGVDKRFALIDLDGAVTGTTVTRGMREEALSELFQSLMKRNIARGDAFAFVDAYNAASKSNVRAEEVWGEALRNWQAEKDSE